MPLLIDILDESGSTLAAAHAAALLSVLRALDHAQLMPYSRGLCRAVLQFAIKRTCVPIGIALGPGNPCCVADRWRSATLGCLWKSLPGSEGPAFQGPAIATLQALSKLPRPHAQVRREGVPHSDSPPLTLGNRPLFAVHGPRSCWDTATACGRCCACSFKTAITPRSPSNCGPSLTISPEIHKKTAKGA